jgi:predicted small lipoprotein YifL
VGAFPKFHPASALARAGHSLYGAVAIGEIAVIRSARPSRWAILVVAAATLALAGCGRKGGLDLPPGAAAVQDTEAQVEADTSAAAKGANLLDSSFGANTAAPMAAKGRKKPFILDPLLD